MYRILFSKDVADDLGYLTANQRARILDLIEVQLKHEPTRQSRNRKILVGLVPPWGHVDPVWQLRVGEYRVFYDVDELRSTVIVRAIRRKPSHKTTEEIL
jgi:mRNA-degrading endonuclease RelE of RelBE toxin-antitoxin system